jgi:hypothetical protein
MNLGRGPLEILRIGTPYSPIVGSTRHFILIRVANQTKFSFLHRDIGCSHRYNRLRSHIVRKATHLCACSSGPDHLGQGIKNPLGSEPVSGEPATLRAQYQMRGVF